MTARIDTRRGIAMKWEGDSLSVRDAARALEVHENTIRNWIKAGRLEAISMPGSRFRRVKSDSVRAILEGSVPSYHDLHITTESMPRTSIRDLPYGYEVSCNRVGGWCVWFDPDMVAGEYEPPGLRLDVGGHVIVDTLAANEATG